MKRMADVRDWLLPAVLILFLLEILLLPMAVQRTYAGRSEAPDHVLTYTTGRLTWDRDTGIDANGAARLRLFSETYQNVQSDNGDRVVAPGTETRNIVRLVNDAARSITYVAVMYRIQEEETLPVAPTLEGEGWTDAETYPLPEGVTEDQVVRAVTGRVRAGELQDFDLVWSWNYYESDDRDQLDTALGNQAAWFDADTVTAGIYIVVEEDTPGKPADPEDPDLPTDPDHPDQPDTPDGGDSGGGDGYIRPQVPDTGDNSHFTAYLVLMAVSGVLLLLLLWDRWRERKCGGS